MAAAQPRYRAKRALRLSPSGFLLDGTNGESFSINRTGALILETVMQGRSLDDAARDLSAAFEVSVAAARRDTVRFIIELSRLGLVIPEGGDDPRDRPDDEADDPDGGGDDDADADADEVRDA